MYLLSFTPISSAWNKLVKKKNLIYSRRAISNTEAYWVRNGWLKVLVIPQNRTKIWTSLFNKKKVDTENLHALKSLE